MSPSPSLSLISTSKPSTHQNLNSFDAPSTDSIAHGESFRDFLTSFLDSTSSTDSITDESLPSSFLERKISRADLSINSESQLTDGLDSKNEAIHSHQDQAQDENVELLINPFLGLIQNQQDLLSHSNFNLTPSLSTLNESLTVPSTDLIEASNFVFSSPSPLVDVTFSVSPTTLLSIQDSLIDAPLLNQPPPLSFETHQALMESSVKLFTHMQSNRMESTVVQATPLHMGPLQATLQHDAQTQQYQISISVVHADAFQMMQDQVHQLSKALDQLGFDSTKIEVHHDPSMHQFISNPVNATSSSPSDAFPSFQHNTSSQSSSQFYQPSHSNPSSRWYAEEDSENSSIKEAGRSSSQMIQGGPHFDRYA